jgi:hypothetical protein
MCDPESERPHESSGGQVGRPQPAGIILSMYLFLTICISQSKQKRQKTKEKKEKKRTFIET